jgi:hypothetical protein
MDYRDRAIQAIQAADVRLRAELRGILTEAIAAEAYADVAAIAHMVERLSQALPRRNGDFNVVAERDPSSFQNVGGQPPATQEDRTRGSSRRDQYPRFFKDGDRLVKVAWSKKERGPYEHKAPRAVITALVNAVQKKKGESKLFQASDIMPLKDAKYDEYPSYQSYLALNWLRDVGVINKRGREGYVLRPNAATAEKLEELWAALPTVETQE